METENRAPKCDRTHNLRKYNKQKFLADLRQIDWISILDPLSNDPDKMALTFHEIFESQLEIHAPLMKKWQGTDMPLGLLLTSEKTWKSGINLKNWHQKILSVQQHYKDLISQNRNDPKKMWKRSIKS